MDAAFRTFQPSILMIKLERPLVFIDLETTGTETLSDRIVELAALKIHPSGNEEIMTARINPCITIPPEAVAVHGITNNDVRGEPTFKEYAPRLLHFLKGCDLAGFNVKRFDLEVLEAEFRRADIEFSRDMHIVDAQAIYHKFEPRDLTAAYRKYVGKEPEKRHSAEADVRAAVAVFTEQLKQHDLPSSVKELHDFCNERRSDNWVDSKGRFVWIEGEAVVNFSRYKGKSLMYMSKHERGFLEWIIKGDFMADTKKLAEDALKGIFPVRD